MRKSNSVVFLIIWFMWSAGQYLDHLVRHPIKSDFYIFQHAGLTPIFFILTTVVLVLNTMTIYALLKPYYVGFYTGIASLIVGLFHNIVSLTLAMENLPGVREVYRNGREIRGLSVREEAMDMIFTEQAMYYGLALVVVFYIVVLFFVLKNKSYFYSASLHA